VRPLRVLMSAYACEPRKGSEPGLGWNWALQMARWHDMTVITRRNNRKAIEAEVNGESAKIRFVYVDPPRWLSFWKRGQRGIYLYYLLWQIFAYREAAALCRHSDFDILHHVTFGNVWMPSFLPLLKGAFIFGPVGGCERVPVALRSTFSLRGRLIERVRDGLLIWTRFLDPWVRFTMSRADLVIARTRITQDALRHMCSGKCEVMLETGISQELLDELGSEGSGKGREPVVLMVGRFLHWKGMNLGIEAFLRLSARFPNARLLILGVGPEEQRLKARAELGNGCIEFLGQRPREEALELMRSSSALLVPSMKDGGTWVIYEAMACELPVVCVDYAGPAELVADGCGIKIPVATPEEVVAGLAAGLERLLDDPAVGRQVAARAKAYLAERYLWESLGEQMNRYYTRVIGERGVEGSV